MTNQNSKPDLFVVDGSNIATEGRSKPSLEQLNEAVTAFREEYPDVDVTVVVDATFGHRIAKGEVKQFDKAVANNELVTPPAGAVGRGDAFILAIADKANAGVFSNDSFQEFHGDYGWLFEHGRLIGGKPVPHVGWVFVDRNPVRGPKSRESIRAAKKAEASDEPATAAKDKAQRRVRKKKAAASEPADQTANDQNDESTSAKQQDDAKQTGAKSGRSRRGRGKQSAKPDAAEQDGAKQENAKQDGGASSTKHVNELVNFLEFVEKHAVGQSITATVASYSSHGAYADFGNVQVYIPLRLMSDPAPTSARKAVTIGDELEVVVAAFSPDRRSIDVALPAMADRIELPDGQTPSSDDDETATKPKKRRASRRRGKKAAAEAASETTEQSDASTAADEPSSESAQTVPEPATDSAETAGAEPAPAKAPAKKRAAKKKAAAKKAPAKKKAAAKKAPAKKKAAAKKAPAKKKAAAKKAPAKKKAAAKKAPAKKKAAAKKAPAKKKAAAKKAAAPAAETPES
ncbi:MAG: S1 RNA-binding domain-containing protein [Ilumatobacter fluminis]|uniref:S1 RNA-binding domain-containing protein n=1 Tax=Ilumatobacter fluminis TaxID=467091 RepID=UPI0032EED4C0